MPTILFVDDDVVWTDLIVHRLEQVDGMTCLRAQSGEDAIFMLRGGKRPDMILMDFAMHDLDGLETLKLIRDELHLTDIPVIIMSASIRPTNTEWLQKFGSTRFIDKTSVTPADIADAVRSAIASNKK